MAIARIKSLINWANQELKVGYAYDLDDTDPNVAALLGTGEFKSCPDAELGEDCSDEYL